MFNESVENAKSSFVICAIKILISISSLRGIFERAV